MCKNKKSWFELILKELPKILVIIFIVFSALQVRYDPEINKSVNERIKEIENRDINEHQKFMMIASTEVIPIVVTMAILIFTFCISIIFLTPLFLWFIGRVYLEKPQSLVKLYKDLFILLKNGVKED